MGASREHCMARAHCFARSSSAGAPAVASTYQRRLTGSRTPGGAGTAVWARNPRRTHARAQHGHHESDAHSPDAGSSIGDGSSQRRRSRGEPTAADAATRGERVLLATRPSQRLRRATTPRGRCPRGGMYRRRSTSRNAGGQRPRRRFRSRVPHRRRRLHLLQHRIACSTAASAAGGRLIGGADCRSTCARRGGALATWWQRTSPAQTRGASQAR